VQWQNRFLKLNNFTPSKLFTCMKKAIFLFSLIVSMNIVRAQSSDIVSDEELRKYAIMMDSINTLTENIKNIITELVTKNPDISAARYNELSRLAGDSVKLKEAGATETELRALKKITEVRNQETNKLQEVLRTMATDYIGAATYNKIRNALRTDSALKAKYEAMMAELRVQ
jgi:tellurite resistance protein